MLFVLPWDVYTRINAVSGNGQSQLLQELKAPSSHYVPDHGPEGRRPDRQSAFKSYHVEVVPAFRMLDGTFLTAHTAENGSWKYANPAEEYSSFMPQTSRHRGRQDT